MEEKKKKEKLSYDELVMLTNKIHAENLQLQEQNKKLVSLVQELDTNNFFKRLDYLFEVVKYEEQFPRDFAEECRNEIVVLLTRKEEPEQEAEKENKEEE